MKDKECVFCGTVNNHCHSAECVEKRKPRIQFYFHCKNCLNGRLAVGWTKEGIQVYCEECNNSVIDIDFKGQKVEQFKGR